MPFVNGSPPFVSSPWRWARRRRWLHHRMPTVAERYCANRHVPAYRFARHVLRRSLPWQAQVLYPLLRAIPGFFDPDLEFIRNVGRARTLRHFAVDAADFKLHPDNAHPLRRWLKLRVSSRKLRRHLSAALAESELPRSPVRA